MSDPQIVRTVRVEHESGAWAEINASRSRAVDRALRANTWFRDIGPILSPLVIAWGKGDGPMTVDVFLTEEAEPVMSDDGEREVVPRRTVARVAVRDLLPPAEDPEAFVVLSDCDPDLATWLLVQTLLAPATLIEREKKASGAPSSDTPDGTPAEEIPAITPMTSRRARSSSTKPEASISA